MRKIDAHQHFWKYKKKDYAWISDEMSLIKRDFLASDLQPILDKQGYAGCVAVQARQSLEENTFLLEQAASSEIVKGVVGWVDLQDIHVAEKLASYADEPLIKGFRHNVQDEDDPSFMQRMPFADGAKLLDLYDYTYDLLIHEKQMPSAIKFLSNFSGQKIVLDHIGKPLIKERLTNNWKDSLLAMAEYPHLSIKVSGMVTEAHWNMWEVDTFKPYLDKVVEAFGIERIMIGSDWPVCLVAAKNHSTVMKIAEDYFSQFSEEEQAKVYGENAVKFYGL